jgi:hypothetical protein
MPPLRGFLPFPAGYLMFLPFLPAYIPENTTTQPIHGVRVSIYQPVVLTQWYLDLNFDLNKLDHGI